MKVYVVWESALIEQEEHVQNMGVFSSIEKAVAAIKEYTENAECYTGHFEYYYEEFELDTVWQAWKTKSKARIQDKCNKQVGTYRC